MVHFFKEMNECCPSKPTFENGQIFGKSLKETIERFKTHLESQLSKWECNLRTIKIHLFDYQTLLPALNECFIFTLF
jgi:hypothetical protein